MKRTMLYALMLTTTMVCSAPVEGWAMLAPVQGTEAATTGYDRAADIKTVQAALDNKAVRSRLKALGLSDKEIENRMSRMSDQQVHQLAKDLHAISPGGDVGGILVLVILVLLILYLVDRI